MPVPDHQVRKKYELSGGGSVEVFKPFGGESYVAVVEQNGRYPEEGKTAHNRNRDEYSIILEGEFEYVVNGSSFILRKDDVISVKDGDAYSITGKGRALVVVKDGAGGKTEIL